MRGRAAQGALGVTLALGAMLALGGCGFHLQGAYPLSPALMHVRIETVDTQSDFYFGLRRALQAAGARIDDEHADPSAAVIRIIEDATTDNIVAVSTLNVPTEYELTYTVQLSVEAAGHQLIAPEQRLLRRDYSYNEAAQLAKQREQAILTRALAQELAAVVMRQLSKLPANAA